MVSPRRTHRGSGVVLQVGAAQHIRATSGHAALREMLLRTEVELHAPRRFGHGRQYLRRATSWPQRREEVCACVASAMGGRQAQAGRTGFRCGKSGDGSTSLEKVGLYPLATPWRCSQPSGSGGTGMGCQSPVARTSPGGSRAATGSGGVRGGTPSRPAEDRGRGRFTCWYPLALRRARRRCAVLGPAASRTVGSHGTSICRVSQCRMRPHVSCPPALRLHLASAGGTRSGILIPDGARSLRRLTPATPATRPCRGATSLRQRAARCAATATATAA